MKSKKFTIAALARAVVAVRVAGVHWPAHSLSWFVDASYVWTSTNVMGKPDEL